MCNDTATPQLEELVTTVANQLMTVDAATSAEVSQRVLAYLVEQLGVDVSFLRHNDRDRRATRLVAEWPPRLNIPDPDPLRLIYFADADPVFALCEHAKEPLVFRPEPATEDYQRLIEEARGVPVTSAAAVPLVSGEITTGLLGFIKFGDRKWHEAELNALMTIATLFAQVQARVAAEARLRYLADHDDLTGLHNRRALLQHLDQRLAPGQPGPVAALFLDLDRLKAINDYLGHAAGDQFIHVFAQRIGDALVGESLIARLGGDEFVLIPASPMSADAAQPLAERLRDQLKDHVAIGGEVLTRTVSIGVASGTPGQHTPSDLLRRADQAALAAKHAGGDSVAIFTADMSVSGELRNDIELHLRRGIESDALRLVYLPEVDLRTGDIVGTEALVRWQHPTRGLLAPGCFIPVAESINLAGELDRWVLRRACNEFSEWQSAGLGHDALLRINVSAGQLVTGGFVDFVADTIGQHGLDASSVCLEITENVVVQDLHTARATLARLKEVGVHIAIDDFGTGYSAISLLQTLPIDTLKIDKTFVRQLGTNTSDLVIVRGIMTLAEGFQLDVVAEGVETRLPPEFYWISAVTVRKASCSPGLSPGRPCGTCCPHDDYRRPAYLQLTRRYLDGGAVTAMQTTPGKRQRRQRGSINPEDIISGAFELAQQVSIDNLSMPLLGKHLRVGVTSIYWYFRKKDDLLNAMTDRALSKYVFATPYIEAGDWRETLRNHARSMRKTFADNPVLCDLILIRAALSPKTARLGAQEMEKAIANLVTAGLSLEDAFDIYSAVSVHVRGSVVLDRLSRKSQSAGSGPSAIEHPVAIDPATTPLLAHATGRGHRIGAPDETNFEYGLECILDHAGRLIEQSSKAAGEVAVRRPTATADAPTPGARAKAVAR